MADRKPPQTLFQTLLEWVECIREQVPQHYIVGIAAWEAVGFTAENLL